MKQHSNLFLFILLMSIVISCKTKKVNLEDSIEIPPGGNTWIINNVSENESVVSKEGVHNWTNSNSILRTFFKTTKSGELHVGLTIRSIDGPSTLKITIGNTSKEITIENSEYENIPVGIFDVKTTGYLSMDIQGIRKSGVEIADINSILVAGSATEGKVYYAKDDFYFGKRGPSVHLSYETPKGKDIVWFYNEVIIPEGEDVIGSYFMANGFKDGYFGIQVNSETERRILFSVWSPYETQDPNSIPEDYKIILLDKGNGVTTGEFGNEGSGGQSYKIYDWKAGNAHKFLLKGKPSVNNSTDYTAYFRAPEDEEWKLIASFRRPHTTRHLTNIYSFLENFVPDTGFLSRKGLYQNQWVYTNENEWYELTKAKFTADATARKESRMDYSGGTEGNHFFMRNCGFFDNTTEIGSYFKRKVNETPPLIDFDKLDSSSKN